MYLLHTVNSSEKTKSFIRSFGEGLIQTSKTGKAVIVARGIYGSDLRTRDRVGCKDFIHKKAKKAKRRYSRKEVQECEEITFEALLIQTGQKVI